MNRNCSECNIIKDMNIYKKDRTVCKPCYNKNKRKNKNIILTPTPNKINTAYEQLNNKNVNKNNNGIFQHMKIMLLLLLGPETLVKRFKCSKYLKK